MAATTVETRVVDFSSLSGLLLLPCHIVLVRLVVVEVRPACGLRWHRCVGMRRVIGHGGTTSLLVELDEATFQGRVYKNGCKFQICSSRDVIAPPQTSSVTACAHVWTDPDHHWHTHTRLPFPPADRVRRVPLLRKRTSQSSMSNLQARNFDGLP